MLTKKPGFFRVFFILLLGVLYLVPVSVTLHDMQLIRQNNPENIWTLAHELPQTQFAVFWFSGALLLIALINTYGGHVVPSAWLLKTCQMQMAATLKPLCLTWIYPPTMGLLAMLYALLPLGVSFWVWRALYLAISAVLLRRAGLGWFPIVAGLLSPAAWLDVLGGENGTLTGGLLVSSLLLMERQPGLAGVLGGLLCIKPQMGLALPLALLRHKRALAGFAACVLTIVALTLPLEGVHSWVWFLSGERRLSIGLVTAGFNQLFPLIGATVFYMARSFGASLDGAWAVQAGASLLAAAFIAYAWWTPRFPDAVTRMAFTVSLAPVLTPYGYLYDLVGFSVAMTAMATRAGRWQPAYALLWLVPGYSGLFAAATNHIFMPVATALAAGLVWVSAPAAPQTPPRARNPA